MKMRYVEQLAAQRDYAPLAQAAKSEYDARVKPSVVSHNLFVGPKVVAYRDMGWNWHDIAKALHISAEQAMYDYRQIVGVC